VEELKEKMEMLEALVLKAPLEAKELRDFPETRDLLDLQGAVHRMDLL